MLKKKKGQSQEGAVQQETHWPWFWCGDTAPPCRYSCASLGEIREMTGSGIEPDMEREGGMLCSRENSVRGYLDFSPLSSQALGDFSAGGG